MRSAMAADNNIGPAGGLFATYGDVVVVLAYALVIEGGVAAGVFTGPLRVMLALPLLFFLPGYALVAALFPARSQTEDGDGMALSTALRQPGLEWVERGALSLGASLVVLPLIGVALPLLGVPYETTPVVSALVLVTGVGMLAGAVRRLRLPASERLLIPVSRWYGELRAGTVDADSSVDVALNVALAVAVVVSVAALGVGLAAPQDGETFTEVGVLTQQGGELVASGYPANVTQGEATNFTLSVENREGESVDYTSVVVLERVRTSDGSVTVLERSELERVSMTLANGETTEQQLTVRPDLLGENLRLRVLVYEGEPPAELSAATADNYLTLWLDVTASGSGASVGGASESAAAVEDTDRISPRGDADQSLRAVSGA